MKSELTQITLRDNADTVCVVERNDMGGVYVEDFDEMFTFETAKDADTFAAAVKRLLKGGD